jgi:hypothetical protein
MLARPPMIRIFCCFLLLVTISTADGQTTDLPQKGRSLVLLTNDRILAGNVELRGSQYFISREDGDEIYLPVMRVRKIGKSLEDLYQFQLADAQERGMARWIEIGHWALEMGLIAQAESQVRLVQKRYPDHPEVIRLQSHLEHVRELPQGRSGGVGGIDVQQASFNSPTSSDDPAEAVSAERLEMFASRVQPVLVNLCRRCHQTGDLAGRNRDNAWAIDFVAGGRGIGSEDSTNNLIATDAWMARQSDLKSFLLMATSAHGGLTQPPISPRHREAVAWIAHFCETRSDEPTSTFVDPTIGTDQASVSYTAPLQVASVPPELASISVDTPSTLTTEDSPSGLAHADDTPRTPRRVAPVSNPHDADIFNQR